MYTTLVRINELQLPENQNSVEEILNPGKLLNRSWDIIFSNYWVFLGSFVWQLLRALLVSGAVLFMTIEQPISAIIVPASFIFVCMLGYVEIPEISLKLVRGEEVQLFARPKFVLSMRWLTASCLFLIAVILSGCLFILPGLAAFAIFSLYGFAVIDGAGPVQSLKQSHKLLRGSFKKLLVLLLPVFIFALLTTASPFSGIDLALDMVLTVLLASIYVDRKAAE